MSLINLTWLINKLTMTLSLSIYPLSEVIISIRINESSVAVISIISEHTFINDVVNFFTDTSNLSRCRLLSNDVFIVLALTELHGLVNVLCRIGNNIFKSQWPKLIPFFLSSSQCNTMGILLMDFISFDITLIWVVCFTLSLWLSWCKTFSSLLILLIQLWLHRLIMHWDLFLLIELLLRWHLHWWLRRWWSIFWFCVETWMVFIMYMCSWERSSSSCVWWDSPMVKLFEELNFFILIHEFWE